MDGMHDLGGRQGFGKVRYAPGAAAFHEPWEVRANSLYAFAVRCGIFNMDEYRHAIERMDPRHYLAASYYERSLTGLATLLVEKGIVTAEELERRAVGAFPLAAPIAGGRTNVSPRERFKPGERVRVRLDYVTGHVRMPAYVRGKSGVVVSESPPYPFPDASAHGIEAQQEPTYDVQFRSEELWPSSSDPALVHVGVFESYLQRVP
ncbi:MAG: nitrile hydratase subunit beta [Gammaproteobacteria bacterium]|nr:nitrile hydratase subunit beta [Gammaproteobacteria bacterium]